MDEVSQPRPEDPPPSDVPADLADQAYARLMGAEGPRRATVLAELCRQHPEHADGLRHLWAEIEGAERALDGLAVPEVGADPDAIGPFRVIRRLGEGAFGVVYLCAQHTPIERRVAVKVLRPAAGDRHLLARFRAERQLLATMNHPAIANVFDAGALADGRPYLAMEFVEGLPISDYCDEATLSIHDRLGLFLALCDGVAYAHQRGVIHRDLKPSNVLVHELSGRAQPKIIDFGLAKVMAAASADTRLTEVGVVVGTPGYMSPEQSEGRADDVDTRADVFALGVILYELLTGELPWQRGEPSSDRSPPRPSTRMTDGAVQSTAAASHRGAPPRRLRQQLRGDLDWITLRALEYARERRYQTVQELAEDVRRHLRHESIAAGPPSAWYRLRKFVRRYRVQVVAVAAVLLSLLLGLFFALRFAATARDNLRRFDILALGTRLELAQAAARELFPPWPDRLPDFEHWLREQGEPVHAELPRLEQALAELRAQALPYTDADRERDRLARASTDEIRKHRATIAYLEALLAHRTVQAPELAELRATLTTYRDQARTELTALEQQHSEGRTWRFASASQSFLHDTMVRLQRALTAFGAAGGELRVIAAQRREIVAGMAEQERLAPLWQRVADEVAADPRFHGLQVVAQYGLVPLGRDPESGLQEFYHPRSGPSGGATPARGADGRLQLDEKAGIVFVLLPGASAVMGAQSDDPGAPRYDPEARNTPPHAVDLAPFFLGKHEVTQNQWWYLTDTVPAHFHPKVVLASGLQITMRHPVENVTWQECQHAFTRQGLCLPTEAQWEYACRAGTDSIWSTGDTPASLAAAVLLPGDPKGSNELLHRPVGSLAANAFGLHDMIGNVAEWCRDNFSSLAYLLQPEAGDALHPVPEMQNRVVRGGSFEDDARQGASAARHAVAFNTRAPYLGVRAARALQVAPPK